jgi:two-component system LytT family response regulator
MSKLYKTIIIDDEPLAIERLEILFKGFPDTFQVIDTAKNGKIGKEKIERLQPDLIFLDIEMPGLNGFQMLEKLESIPLVVFCTAYDEYALKAFETSSIDYLVKPVRITRLEKTIQKLQMINGNQTSQQLLEVIKELSVKKEAKKMTSITVTKGDTIIFVKLEDITYLEADEKYVTLYTDRGNHIVGQSLNQLEKSLPDYFLRVHRGVIVNTNYVKEIQKYFNSRYIIKLQNKGLSAITTGRSYSSQIKTWMNV